MMQLQFNLEYRTTFGEDIALNVITSAGSSTAYRMRTLDGVHWRGDVTWRESDAPFIDYFYSVIRYGQVVREEWRVEPHRLEFVSQSGKAYIVYDNWIDIPEDAYMYSAAFTDCIEARKRELSDKTAYSATLRLKVRAPQLRRGEQLAILGREAALGEWKALRAIRMTEHEAHEWVVSLDGSPLSGQEIEFKFVILDEPVADVTPEWEAGRNRSLRVPVINDGEIVVMELPGARFDRPLWRGAGVVVPVFALRSEGSFGVGDFGDLRALVDWAASAGMRVVQVLPVNDTTMTHTWEDSYPYNCISVFALHPQYIDLRALPALNDDSRKTYYEELRRELNALPAVDYERVNAAKTAYLRELYAQEGAAALRTAAFKAFFAANKEWLVPYAVFCHYRDTYGTADFTLWRGHRSLTTKDREQAAKTGTKMYKDCAFWYYMQYNLDKQMRAARDHARDKRIVLKGDIPIGVSRYGADIWTDPQYFNIDGQAGAPPDAFSVNGQNWGFPTYNWDAMLADGCAWWVRRLRKMSCYFDAYRIDHVLGFFRIWEIPSDAVHGLLGQFAPAIGMTAEEIEGYGLHFDESLFTVPFITDSTLAALFGDKASMVAERYLDRMHDDRWVMKSEYATQRAVEAAFRDSTDADNVAVRDGLYALISDVLFVRDRREAGKYHPRISAQSAFVYGTLSDADKNAFNKLYDDYYYRRNDRYWYSEAMKKLPIVVGATRMLACAEDLGMVPSCVPWVMDAMRILSLEIQSMPKDSSTRFGHLSHNPYRSVCTISTHDMPTMRQWWDEDDERTQDYFNTMLYHGGRAPHPLPGWLAQDIVSRHLTSPSMLCILSLQDWMAIDEQLRLPDKDAERINVPSVPRHYWRYRMHINIEQLMAATDFNNEIKRMIRYSGRK